MCTNENNKPFQAQTQNHFEYFLQSKTNIYLFLFIYEYIIMIINIQFPIDINDSTFD